MRLNLIRGASLAAACALLVSCADKVNAPSPQVIGGNGAMDVTPGAKVVISQVYGGGGNALATYNADFVELFNAGTAAQSLVGWTVQYASATGTGNFGITNQIAALTGSIAPGQYYLVKLAGGATGANLPTADVTVASVNMAGGAGKVALVDQAATLGCNGAGAQVCSPAQLAHIIDLVGYGNANFFEGAGAAPTLTNSTAALRKDFGCTDTNNNAADFTAPVPAPRNTASATHPCTVVVGPLADITISGAAPVNTGVSVVLTATLKDAGGNTITDNAATYVWHSSNDAIVAIPAGSNGKSVTLTGGTTPGAANITVDATSNSVTKTSTVAAVINVTGPLDHVTVAGPSTVANGSSITLTATLKDAIDQTITDPAATYTWTSSDPATAQVLSTANNTATIKGLVPGGPITISLSATSNGVTKSPSPQASVTVTGAPVIVPSTTVVSEVHYDNAGTDADERIEIEGNSGASLDGWKLVLYDGSTNAPGPHVYNTVSLSGIIPSNCDNGRGVVVLPFAVNGIQNGSPDGWALVNPLNQVTEFKSYEGTMTVVDGPAVGLTSSDIGAFEATDTPVGRSVQRAGNGVWFGPKKHTFGACNRPLPPPPEKLILRDGKDLLALGMQTQWFFDDNSGTGVTSVVWSSSDPTIFSVDSRGIVSAKKLGTATLTATSPTDASIFGTVDIEIYLAPTSSGIRLGHNEEFGEPRDANDEDDFLIHRAQYTVSYNKFRGGANWVSWNLSASHLGDVGRCSGTCYSADTALINAGITAYTTADWVSGGVWDRGHMAPSADWQASEADNNTTFFLSNFLPQAPDLNQGPWERLEAALRDTVGAGREVYIIAGGIFTNGVGLGAIQGKIQIPDSTWKIAVIVPAGQGIGAGGTLPPNTTVLAVNMPNVQGIRGVDWRTWVTTIGKIERSTGYNFLDLLSEPTQCLAEGRNCVPTARITGASFATSEGQSLSFSGATSTDPNVGDVLTKQWYVNGAPLGTGDSFSYTFANDGSYEVKLIVTDVAGANSTAVATVAISNVAPVLDPFAGGNVVRGEAYTASGTFSDPGADSWSGTVNYGDGTSGALAISGHGFTVSHAYSMLGTFTVTVTVNDGMATDTRTATVEVVNVAPAVGAFSGATILRGETYSATGSFTDQDPDSWTGTVSYGDGTTGALSIDGHSFAISHAYSVDGTFTVTVSVSDGMASSSRNATVVVKSALQGIGDLDAAVLLLGLTKGQANSLQTKLANAAKQLRDGKNTPAANVLEAFINEVNALAQSGRITVASAAQLTAYAQRVIAAM